MRWPRISKKDSIHTQQHQEQQQAPFQALARTAVRPPYEPAYLSHLAAVSDPYVPFQEFSPQAGATTWIIPKLSLKIDDLSDPGAELLLKNIQPYEAMRNAVVQVLATLYTVQTQPGTYVALYISCGYEKP